MKRIAAILLIIILFFNWYGYKVVTYTMMNDADKQLEAQLDNNQYEESQLIEVRVALNVPYQATQTTGFERHYGEMKVDGQYYTYVKSKIENGYLVLKCIPNASKQKIKTADNDYFKVANGIDQDSNKKQDGNNTVAKNFWSEYDDQLEKFDVNVASDLLTRSFRDNNTSFSSIAGSVPEQPPCNSSRI